MRKLRKRIRKGCWEGWHFVLTFIESRDGVAIYLNGKHIASGIRDIDLLAQDSWAATFLIGGPDEWRERVSRRVSKRP